EPENKRHDIEQHEGHTVLLPALGPGVHFFLNPLEPAGHAQTAVKDPRHKQADRNGENESCRKDENGESPHDESSLSQCTRSGSKPDWRRLEPLGAQERGHQVDEQKQTDNGGEQKHLRLLYTLSQAVMKTHISPRPASP